MTGTITVKKYNTFHYSHFALRSFAILSFGGLDFVGNARTYFAANLNKIGFSILLYSPFDILSQAIFA